MKILIIITLLLMTAMQLLSQDFLYAVAKEPTPVLNTPDFQSVFGGADSMTVKTDNSGLIREMEFIALPGTVFDLLGEFDYGDHKIFKVETKEYEYGSELFVDSRFVELKKTKPGERFIEMPKKEDIYKFLDKVVGSRYCWGGNYNAGIKKLAELYKPKGNISGSLMNEWILSGCDCSGLMYEATNGYTPRNTSKLVNYGSPVEIEGLSAEEIAAKCKPLDMIVWNGHVIYVYDKNTSIQSSLSKGGVVKLDLTETIRDVMSSKTPVNDYSTSEGERFVVRRWFPEQ
ncbi:MAG: peptidoglycan endopeptidase [Ignavibacteria bacterium]|nr:peptidoglycan endopeptidase [Ignavibacteria bacterium]